MYSRLPNHLRTDRQLCVYERACSRGRKRDLWYLTFCFFRHAARRRNVRTAPTMMPKQYTRKRALRLRQNSLLKLVLNLRARSICELYMRKKNESRIERKKGKKKTRQKRGTREITSRATVRNDCHVYLKCKLVYSACGIVLYVSIRYINTRFDCALEGKKNRERGKREGTQYCVVKLS